MPDYRKMAEELFLAPARAYMAQSPQAPQGLLGDVHRAIDPVNMFGGYGGLLAMGLPVGAKPSLSPRISLVDKGHLADFGNDAVLHYAFGRDGQIHLTDINAPKGQPIRGSDMLRWLQTTHNKPVVANYVMDSSVGFWNKMKQRGLVSRWTKKPISDGKRDTPPE